MHDGEIVRIYKSYVEPWDKHLLWMRPCLPPNNGYDLLYWKEGEGWHVWVKGCNFIGDNGYDKPDIPDVSDKPDKPDWSDMPDDSFTDICEEIPDIPDIPPDNNTPCNCN